eukprot:CAMPEP_0194125450 /NCGR_PEP_ID=MMETSP0150-20130528/59470_1 /TAXON_ID=122233 /ORGANISM="Chaetoceros debilis, Strain MM31A-1" /LENGTH=1205 /DNA_ID=CAMNT_0038819261 /DNA_START=97 /DNA_END=3711 /DNA_ORIENTATION=-
MDLNELAEMRAGDGAGGVSLVQGDIPNDDDEEADLRHSPLATADPQFVQNVAASLMKEDWFEKKLKEKISYLLNKQGSATSAESEREAASTSESQPLVQPRAEGDDEAQNEHNDMSFREERPHRHQIRDLKVSPENAQAINDIITNRLFAVEDGLVSMERRINSEFMQKEDSSGDTAKSILRIVENAEDNNSIPSVMKRSAATMLTRTWSNNMPEDTFSMMMIGGKPSTISWKLGALSFIFQMSLCILIFIGLIEDGVISNVPFQVDLTVRVGQFMCLLFCVVVQSDVVTSIQTLSILRSGEWKKIIDDDSNSEDSSTSTLEWTWHVLLPNIMKLGQGLFVTVVSFVIVMLSEDIIDLIKDFSALVIISEFDNFAFQLALAGFFGEELQLAALKVTKVEFVLLKAGSDESETSRKRNYNLRSFVLAIIMILMYGSWSYFVILETKGTLYKIRFPDCSANHTFAKMHLGNGECYGGELNTLACEFEYGDCINFNTQYPLCRSDDLINVEETLASKECNPLFAISECQFQNGACCPIKVFNRPSFGDELICNGGIAATSFCDYDNKDCSKFNRDHPKCPLHDLSQIDGSGNVLLGNDVCDSGVYNSNECGWENGDCAVGQVGQDLQFLGNISSIMSQDGSTLVFVPPYSSPATLRLYQYDIGTVMWIELINGDIPLIPDKDIISIAMNSNGTRFALGHSSRGGYVNVYDITSQDPLQTLVQIGQRIDREEEGDLTGRNIDLSADGSMVVVAAPKFGNGSGKIRIFTLRDATSSSNSPSQGNEWQQVGEILWNDDDQIGKDFLNLKARNGTSLLLASKSSLDVDPPAVGFRSSTIQIYSLINSGNKEIDCVDSGEFPVYTYGTMDGLSSLFTPFAVSGDGTRIVIIANATNPEVPAAVTVLDYNPDSGKFDLPVNILDGSEVGAVFIGSVAISNDGNILAVSSLKAEEGVTEGSVAIYTFDRFENKFRASISKPEHSNVIMAHDSHRDKNAFGLQLSLAENIDSSGRSTTRLSILSHNFGTDPGTDPGYVQVLNLNEQLFYPKCTVFEFIDIEWFGDSYCNYESLYNTEACGWDGSDCSVDGYPSCVVPDPESINDNFCHDYPPYNTEACSWDGGDCKDFYRKPVPVDGYPDCIVHYPEYIGDNFCHDYPPYNTEACSWDGGDCKESDRKPVDGYPSCIVHYPEFIGDFICNDWPPYNTEACSWDGGD